MKYIKNTWIFFALIAGLAACSSEHDNLQEYGNYPQDGVVRISSMVTKAFSRASTPYAGNTLGLCLEYGVGDKYNTDMVRWNNVNGSWKASKQMLWKNATDPVNVYAYAPFQVSATDVENLPFAIVPDQTSGTEAADLVYEYISGFVPSTDLDANTQALSIDFNHALVKLTVNMIYGNEFDGKNLTVKSVKLNQTASYINFNLTTGEAVITPGYQPQDILMYKVADDKYEAIFYPSQGQQPGEKMIDVTMSDGKIYQYVVPTSGLNLEAGKAYEMSLRVGKDKMLISNNLSIKSWEPAEDLTGGEAEKI